jgi:hypothetical protein
MLLRGIVYDLRLGSASTSFLVRITMLELSKALNMLLG